MSFSFSARLLIDTPQVTGSPSRLGAAHDVDGIGAGDHRRVVARAGEPHEPHVALQHHRLGLARDAGQAEPRGELALVHDALADEVGILDVMA